jgi:hypothetical protein
MAPRDTSTLDREAQRPTADATGTTDYTLEADVGLVDGDGIEEVEPFRATVAADAVEDAVEAFRRVARERLVEDGPYEDVRCPPFPGHGDYRFRDSE